MTEDERDESWARGEGEMDGLPVAFRARLDLESLASPDTHPWRLVLTWFCSKLEVTGLPAPEDQERAAAFEVEVAEVLESPGLAYLAFVASYDGTVELNYYARQRDESIAALEAHFGEEPDLPLQVAAEEEEDWADYFAIRDDLDL